jgi:predicted nuclease of restriction endonuclease-like (RecB) superfamily
MALRTRKKRTRGLERKKTRQRPGTVELAGTASDSLLQDVRALIAAARGRVSRAINSELVLMYWRIGHRIREDVLGKERAAYGERIIESLATALTAEYGRGFARAALLRMVQFAELFPDPEIVATLSRQLGWSHFVELLTLKQPLQREFYAAMASNDQWSVRTLRDRIRSMLFERTAFSRKPEALAREELNALREDDRMSPDLVFRDPYILDFLGLPRGHSEKDLEAAILRELESFLLELGTDFAFVARQKRMSIGGDDFYLDLLFFHRRLRALVALELLWGAAHNNSYVSSDVM